MILSLLRKKLSVSIIVNTFRGNDLENEERKVNFAITKAITMTLMTSIMTIEKRKTIKIRITLTIKRIPPVAGLIITMK